MSRNDTDEDEIFTEVRRSRRRGAARPRHTEKGPSMTEEQLLRRSPDPDSYNERVRKMTDRTDPARIPETARHKKKISPLKIFLPFLLILLLAGGAYAGWKILSGSPHTAEPGYYTVAVFGVDSRNGHVGKEALSDVNVIARFDMGTGEIRLVSLYRDTYSQISEDGKFHKLNEAYFRGGPEQAVWALEHNTDVKVDDYATFNWKAIADAINLLGGIDLEITDAEFKYINAFITETVNSTGVGSYQLEHAGMNHLDGVQAVAYARLRLMDTDFNRTERQRKVVKLAFEKAKEADFLTLNNILVTVMPQISTSVTIDDMLPFARNIYHFYIGETAGFPFDKEMADVGKLDCVIPVTLESNARALHAFLYPDKAYEPSALLKEISEQIISDTGFGGSGETNVKTDAPLQQGGQSSGSQAAPAETVPAETGESVSTEETSETETEESTEETGETDENGEPVTSEAADESESAEDDGMVVSPAITDVTPELIGAPSDSGFKTSGGSGDSIDDAVVVSPASGNSGAVSAGPGGSSGEVPTAAGPGPGDSEGAGAVFSADSPGSVSEGPGIAAEDVASAEGPGAAIPQETEEAAAESAAADTAAADTAETAAEEAE